MTNRCNAHKGKSRDNWTNYTYFVLVLFSLVLALAYQQQGEFDSNKPSLFFGTSHVTAAVATAALSMKNPRAGRPTIVSMTAGSSRTLIELDNPENDESGQFHIEVTYLDEGDEDGLMILRRANTDIGHAKTKSASKSTTKGGRVVFRRVIRVLKNPIVALVLTGNIASMIGILPAGIAGFLPAVGIFLGRTKWTAPVLRGINSFRTSMVKAPVFKAVFSKLKFKLSKVVSNLYKNRSKCSALSDFLSFVEVGDEKSKQKNNNGDDNDASAYKQAIA